ncbi:MAG: lipid-A-disaccharide synthase N-terminal domain-containing protein [Syntrophotaleaceae bacterium]
MFDADTCILVLGLVGQGLFSMRFIIQWVCAEKRKQSVIPVAFWYFSLAGSILLLTYAVLRRDLVFTLGQSTGFLIYCRNIYFIRKQTRLKAPA